MSIFEHQLVTLPSPEGFYENSDGALSHDHDPIKHAQEQPQATRDHTAQLERNKVLPTLELASTDSQAPTAQPDEHWMSRAAHLFVGLTADKPSDPKWHPIKAAEEARLGASLGAAVGLMAIGPEVAIGAAAAGLGYAAYQLHKSHSASSPEQHLPKSGI